MHMHYSQSAIRPSIPTDKGMRRRLRLLTIAVLCFLAWAGLTFWNQMQKINVKASELTVLNEQLAETQETNEKYKLEVVRLNDSEYIEQKIRKDYHYTRNGETTFYTPKITR
jgi:cell division protein DivIC